MRKLSGLIVIFLSLFFLNLQVQLYGSDLDSKIEQAIKEFIKLEQFSGCVLLAKDGKILFSQAYGDADKSLEVKNSLDTKFNIGSITKTFTAVGIMQLEEKGLLDLNDPVVRHLEDFPFGEKITIYHLLTHTSGLPEYHYHPDFRSVMFWIRNISEIIPLIYNQELKAKEPGKIFSYCNAGFVLLGAIIEK